jgi:PAS domain S-box-containing protein
VDPVAKILFDYLRDVIYSPARAALDIEKLPEAFRDVGEGLKYLAECVFEAKKLAHSLSKGDLDGPLPSPGNEIAAPLKALHASQKHLSWQSQQVAKGDFTQRVQFMGDFSTAFNTMVLELEERSKIEADEKSKLQRYVNLLLSNTQDIILLFDMDVRVVFTSASYLRCCKIEDPDAIRDTSFLDLFAPVVDDDFLQRVDGLFQIAIAHQRSAEMEQEIDFGRDGNLRHYRMQLTPMLDEKGVVVGTMLFCIDVTESRRAQQDSERARELAEHAARARTEFLARMSHEMRTPLNAVLGMTTVAKSTDDPGRKASCLDKIQDASQHLLSVIGDILDMSSLEADNFKLAPREFNFTQMARRVVNSLAFLVEEKKLALSVDLDEGIPADIRADEQRLAQVLTILLSNAVKFTPEHGAISLIAKKTAIGDGRCTLRFVVQDTGIGISEEQQKHLFVAFEQADGGFARKFGGTGLGLAIAKGIVEMMDGRIWVESEPGKGSSFFFEIMAETGEQADALPGGDPLPGKRVLIAEDVDINREVISALLEDTGLEIVFACDGAEAVAKFSAAPGDYNVILMDIHMPDVDGYEATRRIRSSGLPGADAIPIIAMTANVSQEDIEHCLAVGMNSHLGKPINIALLLAELKKYLGAVD